MPAIQKNDIVCLADDTSGRVIEVINAKGLSVYKIEKILNQEITYIDGSLIHLRKQSNINFLICALQECFLFLRYVATSFR
jgi:hypothetical protein